MKMVSELGLDMLLRLDAFHPDDAHICRCDADENLNPHFSTVLIVGTPPLKVKFESKCILQIGAFYFNPLLYMGHLGLGN